MDVREKLARLNPTTVKFDTGHGGIAELTNQDIAAALAFVPAGLGREVLEACWWPGGAMLRTTKLRDAVMGIAMPELGRQAKKITEASLDVQLAEAAISWSGRGATAEQMAGLQKARDRLARVRGSCWPQGVVQSLPNLAAAVIMEMTAANRCEACHGTGVSAANLKCEECEGCGFDRLPDLRRAKVLKTDSRNFVRHWKPVYEWLMVKFRDAEADAASALGRALARMGEVGVDA